MNSKIFPSMMRVDEETAIRDENLDFSRVGDFDRDILFFHWKELVSLLIRSMKRNFEEANWRNFQSRTKNILDSDATNHPSIQWAANFS